MRRFLMTVGFGLALFGTTAVASAQEKQAPAQKAVQAPTQKHAAPVQKQGAVQAPTQKHVAPVQKHGAMQAPTQKHVQKPTQKPVQKGGDCCNGRTRLLGRRCC